jgi:tryptophan 2,3-dioxygenase
MDANDDANWWAFSVGEEDRGEKIREGPGGLREVNPVHPGGRRLLDYRTYVGLDRLLTSQVPGSRVPDERVFLVTHQLFEIVFKLMVFDLAVISETFHQLLSLADDERFLERCTLQEESGFWRPSLTASGRLKYSSKVLLPALLGYLSDSEDKDETFSSLEFYKFREYLPPASGFQTAQYRLIQRGLGKSNLLSIRLFPGDKYWKNYEGQERQEPVRVIDPLVLRQGFRQATPSKDSPESGAAELDDRAHRVLVRLSAIGGNPGSESVLPVITRLEIDSAVDGFRQILAGHRSAQKKAGVLSPDAGADDLKAETTFLKDLEEAADREKERRAVFRQAGAGALYLREAARGSHLVRVLTRIAEADDILHGSDEESFVSVHYRMAAKRINDLMEHAQKIGKPEPPAGTGGGGPPYLWFVNRSLIPLFPALVGFRPQEQRMGHR